MDVEKSLDKVRNLKLQEKKKKLKKTGAKRLNRSWYGDLFLSILLIGFGLFSAYPLVFTIANAFKPLDEIFLFPPTLFPRNATFENFTDLFNLIGNTSIPLSRYFFNTLFITVFGVTGHVLLASLAAYPLAKHSFPGKALINQLIMYSLMFSTLVTAVPNYLVIDALGLIDSHWAIIVPAWGFTLGLFLMKQFMVTIPTELLEAAKMDGAGEYMVFFKVVMPLVKPAWLTVIILLFQQLWSSNGGAYIFTENLKPLSFALEQIVAGGIARTGASAAVALLMLVVPVGVFILSQTKIIDTMAHSGIK